MADFSSNKPYLIRALYEWILDNQGTPHLIVNADYPGVQVPREHVNNGEIVLNVSPHAVQGLVLENEEVHFNARFSGVARVIRVPVAAILAIIARENAQGMAFPVEEYQEGESADCDDSNIQNVTLESSTSESATQEDTNHLRETTGEQGNEKSAKSSTRKRSHLKVVK